MTLANERFDVTYIEYVPKQLPLVPNSLTAITDRRLH